MMRNAVGIIVLTLLFCGTSLAMTVDGDFGDWTGVTTKIDDDQDMADSSGDVKMIQAAYEDGQLYLRMAVYGIIAPAVGETPAGMTNRYYYHWILDTDDNVDTGFNNSEYEGNATNVDPIGVDVVVQIGWRDGAPSGVYAYDPLTEEELILDFAFEASGDSVEAVVPLEAIGVNEGDTGSFSAFQEGASDDWAVDWLNPAILEFVPMAVEPGDKLTTTWGKLKAK